MPEWEYKTAWTKTFDGYDTWTEANEAWRDKLNLLGEEGWQLVSEHKHSGRDAVSLQPWLWFSGTLMRPTDSAG